MADLKIKRALIAVYDKTGIAEFARALVDEFGIEIISTGGTAKHLKDAGIPVTLVEEVTGFPEMLDGRVKTLHPRIHAAILADRDNPDHMRQLAEHNIQPIDMVVVNLYPFEKTAADPTCSFDDAIEMIDIGGPCLLRAAAKNHKHVLVICEDPAFYDLKLGAIRRWTDPAERQDALVSGAISAYLSTARYDARVACWLDSREGTGRWRLLEQFIKDELRYGENPPQRAEVVQTLPITSELSLIDSEVEDPPSRMSFNNYVDGDAALGLVKELSRASVNATQANDEPRASARAVARTGAPFSPPDPHARTWLLTWTTYGQWLPGDERGYVSRTPKAGGSHPVDNIPGTPYEADHRDVEESARERMKGKPVSLTSEQAACAYESLIDTAGRHAIMLITLSVMHNHVHLLCQSDRDGAELLKLFKGSSSRQLGKRFNLKAAPRWWTKSGSRRFMKPGSDLSPAVRYVREQKGAICVGSWEDDGAQPRTTARAEARGSSSGRCVVAFIKHTNACGCAIGDDAIDTYRRAYLGDPIAAAGGVLCMNYPVTREVADAVMNSYKSWGKAAGAAFFKLDVWIAPSFDDDAVELITTPTEKRKWGAACRLLAVGPMDAPPDPNELDYKKITGGMLVQTRDLLGLNEDQWKVVTKRAPDEREMADLKLAWLICKHTKSNAITICRDGMLLGNGAGQMSRVKSCDLAIQLARENGHADKLAGAVAAGDAFFPVPDGPGKLIDAGVTAIIHPGGSHRDADTLAACDAANVAMILTGTRHFKH